MMWGWLRRRVAAHRVAARYQVTLAGYLFVGAVAIVAGAAVASGNNLLFLILAAMLGTLLISDVICRLCLAGLLVEMLLPEHLAAREKAHAHIRVRNLKWFASFAVQLRSILFDGEIGFLLVPGRATVEANVTVMFPARGRHRAEALMLVTRFPFGLMERRSAATLETEVLIYPALRASDDMEQLRAWLAHEREGQVPGRGTEFHRLRPYEYSESARNIDWKSSSHTGELQVREFSREEQPPISIFFDACGRAGAEFERSLEECAYLIWMLSGHETRLEFASQGRAFAVPDSADVYAILTFLALLVPREDCEAPANADEADVLFSLRAAEFREAGWLIGHVVDPVCVGANGGTGSSADFDHGGGAHQR